MQDKEENGPLTWTLLGLFCFALMWAMLWIVASHYIVFYSAPVMRFLGQIWHIVPYPLGTTQLVDIEASYRLYRLDAGNVGMIDWFTFVNLALLPYSYLFFCVASGLFYRQIKSIKSKKLNERLGPADLARHMMQTFSDIAPVVAIQESLVSNKLEKWNRQVFPEEFLKTIRYQGKSVLLTDPDAKRTDGDRGLMLDETRLAGALRITRTYKHGGQTLLSSRYLGRQIADVVNDAKLMKSGKKVVIADRLSDTGKAIFAILAPYAYGAKKGREQSRAVVDALNFSAYGTPEGQANLSLDIVQQSFSQWRDHPMAVRLSRVHHWEFTFLFALLEQARKSGKIGTWSFIWLKPMNRVMFYVLNTCGRKTPHSEAALAFSQMQFEAAAVNRGLLPITADGKPFIYVDQVIKALNEEWEFWRKGDDDNDGWWQSGGLTELETNHDLVAALADLNVMPPLPPSLNN